eukprot:357633-Chlamydomonas_euryale.AAC.4
MRGHATVVVACERGGKSVEFAAMPMGVWRANTAARVLSLRPCQCGCGLQAWRQKCPVCVHANVVVACQCGGGMQARRKQYRVCGHANVVVGMRARRQEYSLWGYQSVGWRMHGGQ